MNALLFMFLVAQMSGPMQPLYHAPTGVIPANDAVKGRPAGPMSANIPESLKKPWEAPPKRLVPGCPHPPNAPDVITPLKLEVQVTVGATSVTMTRAFHFSPNDEWRRLCDHAFVLGVPVDPVLGAGKGQKVEFFSPPMTRKVKNLVVFQGRVPKDTLVAGFIGTSLLFPPLQGSPRDHVFILTVKQWGMDVPDAGEDGTHSITIPLKYLNVYNSLKSLKISVFMEFTEPWHYHGANVPEKNTLVDRVQWELTGAPKDDLTVFFSPQPAVEAEEGTAMPPLDTTSPDDKGSSAWLWIVLALIVVLGGVWAYRRWSGTDEGS